MSTIVVVIISMLYRPSEHLDRTLTLKYPGQHQQAGAYLYRDFGCGRGPVLDVVDALQQIVGQSYHHAAPPALAYLFEGLKLSLADCLISKADFMATVQE